MDNPKRGIESVDLNLNHEASWNRVQELKAERIEDAIPLNDDYWRALKKHRLAYQLGTLK